MTVRADDTYLFRAVIDLHTSSLEATKTIILTDLTDLQFHRAKFQVTITCTIHLKRKY